MATMIRRKKKTKKLPIRLQTKENSHRKKVNALPQNRNKTTIKGLSGYLSELDRDTPMKSIYHIQLFCIQHSYSGDSSCNVYFSPLLAYIAFHIEKYGALPFAKKQNTISHPFFLISLILDATSIPNLRTNRRQIANCSVKCKWQQLVGYFLSLSIWSLCKRNFRSTDEIIETETTQKPTKAKKSTKLSSAEILLFVFNKYFWFTSNKLSLEINEQYSCLSRKMCLLEKFSPWALVYASASTSTFTND